jgi:hypothetical protein
MVAISALENIMLKLGDVRYLVVRGQGAFFLLEQAPHVFGVDFSRCHMKDGR